MGKKKIHPTSASPTAATANGSRGEHKPVGVPIASVVKVGEQGSKQRGQADLRFSTNKVSVAENGDFDFDFVYGSDATYTDVMDRSCRPLVKAASEGVSVTMLFLGSSSSEKADYISKLLPLVVQDLYQVLNKSSKGKRNQPGHSFHVKVQAFEIFDEVIQDLFNAENRDLRVVHDVTDGNAVSKVTTRGPYKTVDDVLDAVADSFNARTTAMSDFGPASKHTSTVWQLDIHQQTRPGNNGPATQLHSKLTFVEVASTEKLCEDRSTIRAREGPTLSKSLLTLQTVGESFSRNEHDYASFSESKLSQLLENALAGNSITLCLTFLRQGEGESSEATARLASLLRSGITYPTINDERIQGLIRYYRIQINRLRDELSIASSQSNSNRRGNNNSLDEMDDMQELSLKINELEGRVVKDNLEKLRMKEEKEKIYNKLVEFREKYNQLVEQKSHMQSATIKGEEEKLKISKALLDLRIENNKLVEKAEAEKYELVTRLLSAENEVLQYEMKEENREKEAQTIKAELDDAKRIADEFKEDLITIKESYTRLEGQFKVELSKNEELGVELLTLVNQKNALGQEVEELRKERVKLVDESKSLDGKHLKTISDKAQLEEALAAERKLTERLQSEKMKTQLELQRKEVEYETRRLDLEKNAADLNRERDNEISQLRSKLESEMKQNETQRESLQNELRETRASLKASLRKIKELETSLSEKNEEIASVKTDATQLNEKINSLTESYRSKLLELLNPSGEGEGDEHGDTGTDKEQTALQKELIQTFKTREQDNEKRLKSLQQTNSKIVEKNRNLFSKYSACKNKLEDLGMDVDEVELLGADRHSQEGKQLKVEGSQIEEQLQGEIAILKERLDKLNFDLQDSQEKNIRLSASLKKASRENEVRLSDLQAELKMLEKQKANLEEENQALAQRKGSSNAEMDAATTKRMQEVQDSLLKKIEELQMSKSLSGDQQSGADLQSRNRELELQVQTLRRQIEQAATSNPFPPSGEQAEELRRLRDENAKLRELYAKRGSIGGGAIAEPSSQDSRSYADLLTRCTVAEEELSNYKSYMKKALAKAQMDLKQLREERDMWKNKAGG